MVRLKNREHQQISKMGQGEVYPRQAQSLRQIRPNLPRMQNHSNLWKDMNTTRVRTKTVIPFKNLGRKDPLKKRGTNPNHQRKKELEGLDRLKIVQISLSS